MRKRRLWEFSHIKDLVVAATRIGSQGSHDYKPRWGTQCPINTLKVILGCINLKRLACEDSDGCLHDELNQPHLRLGGSPETHFPPLSSAFLHLCYLLWLLGASFPLLISEYEAALRVQPKAWPEARASRVGKFSWWELVALSGAVPHLDTEPPFLRKALSLQRVCHIRGPWGLLHTLTFFFLCPHMGVPYLLNIKNILCKNQETNIKPKLKFKSSKVSSLLKIRNTAVMVILSLYFIF